MPGKLQKPALSPSAAKVTCPDAKTARIFGIIGLFCFGFVVGLYAVVKGVGALGEVSENPRYPGKGMAIAGIILGIIDIIGWIVGTVAWVNGIHGT